MQLDVEPMDDQSNTESPMLDPNMTAWMDQGFHWGMVQATDGADTRFRCPVQMPGSDTVLTV